MSEGVAPTQGLLVLPKEKAGEEARRGRGTEERLAQTRASPTSAASLSPVQVTKARPRVEGGILRGTGGPRGVAAILIKMSSGAPQGQCQNQFGRGSGNTCPVELSSKHQPTNPGLIPHLQVTGWNLQQHLFLKVQPC